MNELSRAEQSLLDRIRDEQQTWFDGKVLLMIVVLGAIQLLQWRNVTQLEDRVSRMELQKKGGLPDPLPLPPPRPADRTEEF